MLKQIVKMKQIHIEPMKKKSRAIRLD